MERFVENKKEHQKFSLNIEQVRVRQHIMNCFGSNPYISSSIIKSFQKGLIVGSQQGNILFVEKVNLSGQLYQPIRYTSRGRILIILEKPSKVVSISFSYHEDTIAFAFISNEICTTNILNIFDNLRSPNFDLQFDVVCDGFHNGPVSRI